MQRTPVNKNAYTYVRTYEPTAFVRRLNVNGGAQNSLYFIYFIQCTWFVVCEWTVWETEVTSHVFTAVNRISTKKWQQSDRRN